MVNTFLFMFCGARGATGSGPNADRTPQSDVSKATPAVVKLQGFNRPTNGGLSIAMVVPTNHPAVHNHFQ